jgi:hypothetical protein
MGHVDVLQCAEPVLQGMSATLIEEQDSALIEAALD